MAVVGRYPESTEAPDEENDHSNGAKEYFCGFGKWRPKSLQVFRNSKFFTFLMCINSTIEGALVSGFTSVVLSSLERRYRLSSVLAGLIASVFDMSVLISVLFISYFGGRGHKPKWLGFSLLIQGIGAFVFSVPQFIFGHYEVNAGSGEKFESCDAEFDLSSKCTSANIFALVFFFIGNMFIGIGAASLFTVGLSYLDDIVHPKYVTIHIGVFLSFTVVGPALGFGFGGLFLSIYVDPWVETELEPTDPGWVGAWWMCFILSGILSWLCAIPFLMFPKLLPDSHLIKAERIKEMAQKYTGKDSLLEEIDFGTKVKSFPQHLKQVIKTPSWLFITIAVCFSTLIISGLTSFGPKYIESQFDLTASRASLITGAVAIPSGGAGVFVGSLIVFFTKSKGRSVALINWIVTLLVLFPSFTFLIHCPTVELVGVTVDYPNGYVVPSSTSILNSSCTASCYCNSSTFEPICGRDGYTYFSPCRAGCQKDDINPKQPIFENCTCIAKRIQLSGNTSLDYSSMEDLTKNGTAQEGRCDQGCKSLGIFLTILFFALFLIFILQVPNVIITVRSVADEQRTLALGVQSVAFRTFGSIPGPIVFGAVFDSACLYWQYDCNQRGNCWVYNNKQLGERALILALLGIGTNLVFSFLSWYSYPKKSVMEDNAVTVGSCDNILLPEIQSSYDNGEDMSHDSCESNLESNDHSPGNLHTYGEGCYTITHVPQLLVDNTPPHHTLYIETLLDHIFLNLYRC